MDAIQFRVAGIPRAKARVRFTTFGGFAKAYKPSSEKQKEETWISLASKHLPEEPLTCPVEIELVFVFAPTPSWPRWKREACLLGWALHVKKPDVDNLAKQVLDILTDRWISHDQRVVKLTCEKRFGRAPSTWVAIKPIPDISSKTDFDKKKESHDEKVSQPVRKISS